MALSSLHDLPDWKLKTCSTDNIAARNFCDDRCGHNSVCIKEELLVWGGYREENDYNSRYCEEKYLWSFNLDLDRWVKLKPTGTNPSSRSGASSGLVWPNWYIFCGCSDNWNVNDVWTLNLLTLVWEKLNLSADSKNNISPRDKAATWVHHDRIYIFGGFGSRPFDFMWDQNQDVFTLDFENGRGWNNQLLYFDVEKKCWVEPLTKGEKPSSRAAHSAVNVNGEVFVFGGRHLSTRLNDLHRLDLESNKWSGKLFCTGQLPEGRSWHTMSRISHSQLLVYGGYSTQQEPLDDAWVLDIMSLSWSELKQSTSHPRLWHTAVTNHYGDVLVFGGCYNNILDHDEEMLTSHQVVMLRTSPFSLTRLCLHQVFKYRCVLKSQWCYLPKQLKDWLEEKDRLQNTKQSTENRFAFSLTGSGPDISQLSVYVGDTGTAV